MLNEFLAAFIGAFSSVVPERLTEIIIGLFLFYLLLFFVYCLCIYVYYFLC